MNPSIDSRDKNDIMKYIRSVSGAYTPEWRFDPDNPDPGAALAMIFADLFDGSIRRFNRIPERYRIAFYNELKASLRPSVPAIGYAGFTLTGSPEGGQALRKGTQLTAATDDEEGYTVFETQNDVCVIKAQPVAAFAADRQEDRIVCLYDYSESEEEVETDRRFRLFSFEEEDLQKHVMYFCADSLLNISGGAWITINLNPHYTKSISDDIIKALTDDDYAVWEYFTQDGWNRFTAEQNGSDSIRFFKSGSQPAFAKMDLEERESFWIRCRVRDISEFEDLHLDSMALLAAGAELRPDSVFSAEMDQDINRFFAFGPTLSVFSEMYIGCEDALCKSGAQINLDFILSFQEVPLEYDAEASDIDWKPVMKRTRVKLDKEYDVTVDQVIWEYFNGSGWAKLFELGGMEDIFDIDPEEESPDGSRRIRMTFTCPEDMEKVLVNSKESYYIRARVIKVNNAFKIRGRYLSPVVESMTFGYRYEKNILPDEILTINNMELERTQRRQLADPGFFFTPFKRVDAVSRDLYIGFDQALDNGPVRMLFTLKDGGAEKPGRLDWSYMGPRGFSPLNVADETEHMRKTGLVSFMAPDDMEAETLWGRRLYWLRISDGEGYYSNPERQVSYPEVTGIFMNVTEIRNVQSGRLEFFHIEAGAEDYECRLLEEAIQEVSVDVLEEGQWIRWREVENFSASGSDSRDYTVDRNEGVIHFSNGFHGKIPPSADTDTIRVSYSTGGGRGGNLQAGQINASKLSLGSIDRIFNPGMTFGGCDIEKPDQAMRRTAASLKHRGRGVTASDIEALVMEASRNILRARCFSGYDARGQRKPGAVSVVILQKDHMNSREFFDVIRKQAEDHLRDKISGSLASRENFYVAEPVFMEICVKAEVTVDSFQDVFTVKDGVQEELDRFLDPISGNFDGKGWEIGRLPNVTQLQNCLKKIPQIRYIRNIYVTVYSNTDTGRVETDLESAGSLAFALPYSGLHQVSVSVDEGR